MRLLLAILLITFSYCAQAQRLIPASVANSYTLTDTDGYPGSNYVHWEYTSSGEVYAKDFFGDFHITGNNFIKKIPGLNNLPNNAGLITKPGNELWLCDNMRIVVIKNDSIWKVVNFEHGNGLPFKGPGSAFILQINPKTIALYEFTNYHWKRINELPKPANLTLQNTIVNYCKIDGKYKMYLIVATPDKQMKIYEMKTEQSQLLYKTSISVDYYSNLFPIAYDSDFRLNTKFIKSIESLISSRTRKPVSLTPATFNRNKISIFSDSNLAFIYGNGLYEYCKIDTEKVVRTTGLVFETKEVINGLRINPYYPYLTVLTGSSPLRIFPYVKKYPRIYDRDNANNIFALAQDSEGRIWAGNYQNNLSIIDPSNTRRTITQLPKQPNPFMNAALNFNNKIYLIGETMTGGLFQYDMKGSKRNVALPIPTTGYYLYFSPLGKKIYFASAAPGYPVFNCDSGDLDKQAVNWERLDSTKGIAPFGMATITEDTLGRIWMGHPKKGFAVYNPSIKKGISYSINNNETPIGFISSLTDKKGTIWMGTDDHGLWYYNDYTKPATPENIHNVNHPLLNQVKRISAMAIYKSWLVMSCYDKICVLNLDSFYQKKKVILRYLNPQEAAFTSFTEQNTMLVSKTDSSVWFSTSDMLYQWDIGPWLKLPQYKVKLKAFLQHNSNRIEMNGHHSLKLPPEIHGFDIGFEYLSPDCLPRFTRTALALKGEKVVFTEAGLQSHYSYKNLSSGLYTFYVQVFEQDGTISNYHFSFIVSKYLWQKWWFWTLASLLFLMPFILWLNTLRKKALHEKEISQLNVMSMSSQFRPHFILNTLNAIGADLKDKPNAESILSRLGESVNLIFNFSQQKKVSHRLQDEWVLINNVIQIHQLIYLPDLKVLFTGEALLQTYNEIQVPLGIVEIVVENALLHGLRNKPTRPYQLILSLYEDQDNLYVIVEDNGVGRKKSAGLSSHSKHGTGTRNMENIISILNRFNKNKIEINYSDIDENESSGTIVKIKIPKIYHYQY